MNVVNSCARVVRVCVSGVCSSKDITVCGMSGLARRLGVGFGTVRKNRFTTTPTYMHKTYRITSRGPP